MPRRTFLAIGGAALAGAAFGGCATTRVPSTATTPPPNGLPLPRKTLTVQPALSYRFYQRHEGTSWRPWGGLSTPADIDQEEVRIEGELRDLAAKATFPVQILPLARITSPQEAAALCKGGADGRHAVGGTGAADVMLIYGATGDGGDIEALISPDRYNLMFLRHKSGPVYLWYEITHPRLLRKTVNEYGQSGLGPHDVIVDNYDEVLWRLRALSALKNTVGSRIVAIGGASGWGAGGQQAPQIALDKWKLDIRPVPYANLAKRIQAARADAALVRRSEAGAEEYRRQRGVTLKTDKAFLTRAFLLTEVFRQLMIEAEAPAITVNECMSTIMPMSETTACMPLSLINDSGALAFCESDFVVIPSGILLHHIACTPVFLNDPTYPHDGVVTVAHCTAPRKMDGKRCEKAIILTHFESDYGAAPKVEMRLGQDITMIDPDFHAKRWVGFRGTIAANPALDICRSQVDVAIDGDCAQLAEVMCGFHWMMAYGDYRKEVGYALRKLGIDWLDLSERATRSS